MVIFDSPCRFEPPYSLSTVQKLRAKHRLEDLYRLPRLKHVKIYCELPGHLYERHRFGDTDDLLRNLMTALEQGFEEAKRNVRIELVVSNRNPSP
jgi:hypothetical protein